MTYKEYVRDCKMPYKEFKKIVLDYFLEHSYVKKKVLKKALKFDKSKVDIGIYEVNFQFYETGLNLSYAFETWELTFQDKKKLEICNMGNTINECCDYLWKLKR